MSITALFLLQPRIWMIAVLFFMFRSQVDTSVPEAGQVSSGPLEGMEFAYIPSGSFMMGSPSSEGGRDNDERPFHAVNVNSFQFMTTEVTQGMWEEVMGYNPSHDYGVGADYPVYYVSWNDCQEFIGKLNNLDPDYTYRLPTESEWEYACRAGTTTKFYWGDSDLESVMGCYCWYYTNSNFSTAPVRTKQPNAWGLYDISGNVWEWCQDWYHISYDGAPSDGSARVSPEALWRVHRGGSRLSYSWSCQPASRGNYSPDDSRSILGFRIVRSET
ncbi:MAG: formylglycine-generating enzyme family protein [Candidatus Sabulitectum sp.]|nr:formylglycine-generating enzyme family protein [Candidatus Sabulitectum sp.]